MYLNDVIRIDLYDLNDEEARNLLGPDDRNLKTLQEITGRQISYRNSCFFVRNCNELEVHLIEDILHSLKSIAVQGKAVSEQDVIYAARSLKKGNEPDFQGMQSVIVGRTLAGKAISPKTKGQEEFVEKMNSCDIVFATGPAGTGKTYLAVVQAVSAMKRGEVKRIVLTRPAVEAGESLGFLPGDLKEKVDPYLTPLYDALHIMLGNEATDKLIERGAIEIAPLAYMRGRTLDDAYVILDEAQNTTIAQMKMFLTRLGFHSHMIITGDVTQIDLNGKQESGLIQAVRILKDVKEIGFVELTSDDVVRHPLVQKIIECYEKAGRGQTKTDK